MRVTPLIAFNALLSLLYILAARSERVVIYQRLPP